MPDEVYEKLERDRGIVPRSTYIQDLINCFGKGVGNITPQHILGKSNDVYGNHPPEGKKVDLEDEGLGELIKSVKVFKGSMFKDDKLNKKVDED